MCVFLHKVGYVQFVTRDSRLVYMYGYVMIFIGDISGILFLVYT